MRKAGRAALVIALLVAVNAALPALELKNGRIKIELVENTGRFAAYYLTDLAKGTYTSFLWDQDPRTTVLSIVAGNTVYRMGESGEFSQKVLSTATGGQFVWTSKTLQVTEDFSFLSSSNSTVPNGFKIAVTIANLAAQSQMIGARYLLDTYLGEHNRSHFSTDTVPQITGETEFDPPSLPVYWISSLDANNSVALEDTVQGAGATPPDRLVFANWRRLTDSPWSFASDSSRDFNLLPYSINDSAAALYWNPLAVAAGANREIDLVLGQYAQEGFGTSTAATATSAMAALVTSATAPSPTSSADPRGAVQSDLLTVENLLSQIDQRLSSGVPVSATDLQTMSQVIATLQQRKLIYDQKP